MSSALSPGTGVLIPGASAPENAFTTTIGWETVVSPTDWRHTAGGSFIDVPLILFVILVTSAVAGNRAVLAVVYDQNGTVLFEIPGATTQPASITYAYTWSYQIASMAGPINVFAIQPWPLVALQPGWQVQVEVNGVQAGDAFQQGRVTLERIPSASTYTPDVAVAVPTPLLL